MKIYYYMVFSAILMMLFYIGGIESTTRSFIFEKLNPLDLANFSNSSLFLLIIGLFGGLTVASIVISAYSNVSPQYVLISTIVMPTLVFLIADLISILNLVDGWVKWLLMLFIIPFVAGYVIALIEFWRGG